MNAAYASYERPLGDLTVLAGVRLEQANLDFDQVTLGEKGSNAYFRAYPSLHLSYRLDDAQKLNASYSRRVQRPSAYDLDPFRAYEDPYNYYAGNPDLQPAVTDSFELGWEQQRRGEALTATLYYRQTRDSVTDVLEDLGDGVILTTRQNLGRSRSGGVELSATGKIWKVLSYNLSGDGFWNEIDAGNLGFAGTRSQLAFSGRGTLNWQMTPKDLLQLNGNLTGRQLTPQGYREPTSTVNLGFRHKIDDRRAIVLTARDVLGDAHQTIINNTPSFRDVRGFHAQTRSVYAGLTWSFGGGSKKPPPPDTDFDFGGGSGNGH